MAIITKLLLTDLASSVKHVPSNYVRSISDRPNLSDVEIPDGSIPLIDLQAPHGPHHSQIIEQIGQACQNYGFFQVKNHGIPEAMINNILSQARDFVRLPESERLKNYTDNPTKTTRLSTSFNVKTEKVSDWRDFLRLHCYLLQDFINEWPSNPSSFRKGLGEYSTSIRGLVLRLLEAISESLGLEKDYIDKALSKHGQHMALNYYPPCPQPEHTYGLPCHTDPNLITILLQDDVPGLQVLRNAKWVAVNPIPNTFIVNIGDQMQVISNDRCKSVLYRAVVNSNKERISIPTFYCPSPDAVTYEHYLPQLQITLPTIVFAKFLKGTSWKKNLVVPSKSLSCFNYEEGRSVPLRVEDESGYRWNFRLYTRRGMYKKPVLNYQWKKFANFKNLEVGDKVIFFKEEDSTGATKYTVKVEKAVFLFGKVIGYA